METVKDILIFCDAAVMYDYKNIDNIDEVNQARKCIINSFHETKPVSRRLISLSIIDDVIIKIKDNDIANVFKKCHYL